VEKDINTQIYDKYVTQVYLPKYVIYFGITTTKYKTESCLGKEYCITTKMTRSRMLMLLMMMMMTTTTTTTTLIIIIITMVMS